MAEEAGRVDGRAADEIDEGETEGVEGEENQGEEVGGA